MGFAPDAKVAAAQVRAEAAPARGRQQTGQSRRLLHRRRRHQRLHGPGTWADSGVRSSMNRAPWSGARGRVRLYRRPAQGLRVGVPAADDKLRFVLDIEPVTWTVTVGDLPRTGHHQGQRDPTSLDRLRSAVTARGMPSAVACARRGARLDDLAGRRSVRIQLYRPARSGQGPDRHLLRRRRRPRQHHHRRRPGQRR